MEVIIAACVLSLFMVALFSVFRGGQQAGAQGLWLQKTVTELRNATRHISSTMERSSYPSTIVFPGTIIENDKDDFKVHYSSESLIASARAKAVTGKTAPGTQFLRFTESIPEQSGGALANNAILHYHVYSVTRDGRLLYNRYQRNIPPTSAPAYIRNISQAQVPSGDSTLVESKELVTDVESIGIDISDTTASNTPLLIDINCAWSRGKTRRNERAVANPNIPAFKHNAASDPDWQLN